jgi:hypothetical protein
MLTQDEEGEQASVLARTPLPTPSFGRATSMSKVPQERDEHKPEVDWLACRERNHRRRPIRVI